MTDNETVTTNDETVKKTLSDFLKKNRTKIAFTALNGGILTAITVVGGYNIKRLNALPHTQGYTEGWNDAIEEIKALIANSPLEK